MVRAPLLRRICIPLIAALGLTGMAARTVSAVQRFAAASVVSTGSQSRGLAVVELDGRPGLDLVTLALGPAFWIGPNQGDGTLAPVVRIPAPALGPFAAADLDGDGLADLVISTSSGLEVLKNLGGLTFSSPILSGSGAVAPLTLVDLDHDGLPEAVSLDFNQGVLRVSQGLAGLRFAASVAFPCGSFPSGFTCADFDNDGVLDIVVVSSLNATVSFLRGLGTRQFASPVSNHPALSDLVSPGAADFDHDGLLDLAVATHAAPGAAILYGLGNGQFELRAPLPGVAPIGDPYLVVVDRDRDGWPDLAVGQHTTNNQTSSIVATWRNGHGSFQLDATYLEPPQLRALTASDLDGDGYEDLVAVTGLDNISSTSASGFSILLNSSGRYFNGVMEFATGLMQTSIQGVGIAGARTRVGAPPDLIASNLGEERRLPNPGDGMFGASGPVGSGTVATARDLDGDGLDDLISWTGDSVLVARSLGGGAFSTPDVYPGGQFFALADRNADGVPDLWTQAGTKLMVRNGDGHGGFGSAQAVASLDGLLATVGDLDGDGRADLIRVLLTVILPNTRVLDVYHRMAGTDGTFGPDQLFRFPLAFRDVTFLLVNDFNGDGLLDLLVGSTDSGAVVLLGDGHGGFQPLSPIPWPAFFQLTTAFATGDLDHDGRSEAVLATTAQSSSSTNLLHVYEWNGTIRNLVDDGPIAPGYLSGPIALGDFTGDGLDDIAMLMNPAGSIDVLRNLGPPEIPTPAAFSLIQAECLGDRAHLRWWTGAVAGAARVERRAEDTGWSLVSTPVLDGSELLDYWDTSVGPGDRRAWRLGLLENGSWKYSEPAWLTMPVLGRLSIERVTPNPADAAPTVRFALPRNGPTKVSVIDVGGREVWASAVQTFAAGSQTLALTTASRLRPGVYLVSVEQAGERAVARFAIVR